MAAFLTSLWEGVFTPGPTPTLLLATNATFAFLQLTLAGLLFATHSIHFLILSVLCGGLWAAINWFAAELASATQKEEEAARIRQRQADDKAARGEPDMDVQAGDEGSASKSKDDTPGAFDDEVREKVLDDLRKSGEANMASATPAASGLQPLSAAAQGETRQRRTQADLSASGDLSTDSEWEQVEQEER